MHMTFRTAISLSIVLFLVMVSLSAQAQSSQTLDVHVNNFPQTQQVKGSVSIEGTMSHSKYFKKEGVTVPQSRRTEPSELVPAGVIETEGFTSITLSMQGEVKSGSFGSGAIGVILIPDEEPIMRALRDAKRIQFPLEGVVNLKAGDSSFFESEQVQKSVAFPRYRIYLYNTLSRTAEANVYLYLTH